MFLAFVVLFFAVWEFAVWFFEVPRYILPRPTEVADQFYRNVGRISHYVLYTGGEALGGYAAAVVLGVPLGLLIAFSGVLRRTLYPGVVTLEMVPKITFAPVFVTWLGFGYQPKLIIVFLVCFFPITLNCIFAFASLSEEMTHFCRTTGAGVLKTFWKVRLPAALPQVFVGLKYAALNATVGAVISEWIGGDAGLGYYIMIATGDLRMDLAFAIIVVLAALGVLLFGLVSLVERWLIPWHISQRRPALGHTL